MTEPFTDSTKPRKNWATNLDPAARNGIDSNISPLQIKARAMSGFGNLDSMFALPLLEALGVGDAAKRVTGITVDHRINEWPKITVTFVANKEAIDFLARDIAVNP